MFDLIAIPLGWLMYLIYQVVHSYGISLIIFTLLVKLLTLPGTYKSQLNMARQGLIAPKLNKIRKSFASNPQRIQEETQKLFREEGINQTAGCLGSLLTMFLLFGVYRVVMQPLTHILRYSAIELENAKNLLIDWATNHNLLNDIQQGINARPELMILSYAKSNPDIFSSMNGFSENLKSFHNSFLGFDLAGIPSFRPETWSFTAVMLLILPFLSGIVNLILTVVSQKHSRKMNPAAPSMGALNILLYLSPIMSVWIGMSVPAGLSFYWIVSSLVQLLMMFGLYKYLSGDRLIKINEKEKARVIAKGPTWMQRMQDQQAELEAQKYGRGRSEANRSRYADGDDGMSRKERAEYERKLIEARRRAVALKYGDEYSEEDDSDID